MFKSFLIIALISIIVIQSLSFVLDVPILFSFTMSNSMEPTIGTGDFFIVVPKFFISDIRVGDIILFYNPKYDFPVCHRVVGLTDEGYITRGDNSPFTDQQAGIPPIREEHIIGKVLTFQGKPILTPKLGLLILRIQLMIKGYTLPLALGLAVLGAVSLVTGKEYKLKKRKRVFKLKVRYVFIGCLAFLVFFTALLMVSKSQTVEFKYLATDLPTHGYIIMLGGRSEWSIIVNNTSLIPFYIYVTPLTDGLTTENESLGLVMPGAGEEFKLQIRAKNKIGWYTEKAGVYLYIAILPEDLVKKLADIHPYAPILMTTFAICLPFTLVYFIIEERDRVVRIKLGREKWLKELERQLKEALL
ncbi:signal peptidase I [Candidatus Bathyarchaeota archaeon]|nr:MAG: signal peptidase I [Candidatus Bathyarchaeota archaeon]